MPILQEKSFGGIRPEQFIGTIMANNPREVAGMKLDVGRPDPAQADRFAMNLQLTHDDIPGLEWLLATYGEDAEPVVDWYREDLQATDPSRVLVTRRTLERIIKLSRRGQDVEKAFILDADGNRYPPISLVDLRARLEDRPLARLTQVVANVDDYERRLEATGDDEDTDAMLTVFNAFSNALLPQLEKHRDVCVRLYTVLDKQSQFNLLRHGGDRQRFWYAVLKEVTPAS